MKHEICTNIKYDILSLGKVETQFNNKTQGDTEVKLLYSHQPKIRLYKIQKKYHVRLIVLDTRTVFYICMMSVIYTNTC